MALRRLLVVAFAALSTAIPLTTPSNPSIVQLPSNISSIQIHSNATTATFGWPTNMFDKPLGWGLITKYVFSEPYQPSGAYSESTILSIIEAMEVTARTRVPATSSGVQKYNDETGPVHVSLSAEGTTAWFTGPMIAGLLYSIWEMILEYGGPSSVVLMIFRGEECVGVFDFKLIDLPERPNS